MAQVTRQSHNDLRQSIEDHKRPRCARELGGKQTVVIANAGVQTPAHRHYLRQLCSSIAASRRLPYSIHCSMRLSGLQKAVLSLYRQCLREIRLKPAVRHYNL